MNDNPLFEKKQLLNRKKVVSSSFLFVFLSLILTIFCFFIYLVQNSSFEKVKVEALKTSLQSSFVSTLPLFQNAKPSFEASQVAIYHQNQIAKMFPDSQIKQDLLNDEISILLPINSIFTQTTDKLTSSASVFFNQLKSLLNANFVKNKYEVDFIFFEDLKNAQNYPIYTHLTTKQAQAFKDKLQRIAIADTAYSVGIEKGDADFFKLHFRKRSLQ